MRNVDSISTENYYLFIEPELNKKQLEVYNCFNGKPLTSEDIAKMLNKRLNQISGRITELCNKKYLVKHERTTNSEGSHCWKFLRIK